MVLLCTVENYRRRKKFKITRKREEKKKITIGNYNPVQADDNLSVVPYQKSVVLLRIKACKVFSPMEPRLAVNK